jgi:hypothetical protein
MLFVLTVFLVGAVFFMISVVAGGVSDGANAGEGD